MFLKYFEVGAKLGCFVMVLLQGSLLNMYLSALHDKRWWAWLVADLFSICTLLYTLKLAKNNYEKRKTLNKSPTKIDEIQYAFVGWLAYAFAICPRIIILFWKHAPKLKEKDLLGPNFLKVGLAFTPLIFLMMVFGYHNSSTAHRRKAYISALVGKVSLDLFDSIDMLDFFFDERLPTAFLSSTLAFSCINLFLPSIALVEVRVNKFEGRVSSFSFKIFYTITLVILVNVPNLVLRSILWHVYDADVSVLIMKNVMCIVIGFYELCETYGEERAQQCAHCNDFYTKYHIKEHMQKCQDNSLFVADDDNVELYNRGQ